MYRNTYVEINIDNLKSNVNNMVNYYKDYKYYFGVVKGNCYGHGTTYVINELIDSGINYLAVSNLEEALEVRSINNEIPILILEPIHLEFIDVCINNNITITIHDYNYAKDFLNTELNKNIKIHLKIDSGMNRLGFKDKKEINEIYNKLKENKKIEIEGIFTHFATLGINDKKWDIQLKKFKELTADIDLKEIPIVHLAKSASFLQHPKIDFANGIRLGIAMYGYDPKPVFNTKGLKNKLRKIKREYLKKKYNVSETIENIPIELKPAYSMYTEIIQIKNVKKGEFVGYGATYIAEENIKIAILAVGYDDGIFRRSKGRFVSIKNKRYKIIGDIGMGMIAVKIDDTIDINDKVTLIGNNIPINEVSKHNGTSIYEVMCNVGKNVPRVYRKNNITVGIEEAK